MRKNYHILYGSLRKITYKLTLSLTPTWELLIKPNTLMERVMKAKYYRTCSIIMEAQVGTGTSIQALHHAFVEEIQSGVPCARDNVIVSMKLDHFITPTRKWNLDRLKELFLALYGEFYFTCTNC